MTRFEVVKSITGVYEFANAIMTIVGVHKTQEEIEGFLLQEFSEEELQSMRNAAQTGDYPISLPDKQ